jgi:DNA-directed RNA polymerase subunit RPC12/RpoP
VKKLKCKNCGKDIAEDEVLPFTGTAAVHGDASIKSFLAEGIIWQVDDSEDETYRCPHCGEMTPITTGEKDE